MFYYKPIRIRHRTVIPSRVTHHRLKLDTFESHRKIDQSIERSVHSLILQAVSGLIPAARRAPLGRPAARRNTEAQPLAALKQGLKPRRLRHCFSAFSGVEVECSRRRRAAGNATFEGSGGAGSSAGQRRVGTRQTVPPVPVARAARVRGRAAAPSL